MKEKFVLLVLLTFGGCQTFVSDKKIFIHDAGNNPTPWSYEPVGRLADDFTFAIISDLNGGERDGIFEVAMEQISLLRPEFVMSVGDLVNGETDNVSELTAQYDSFDRRAAAAHVPVFHVGGNHDLTSVGMRDFWELRYGSRYYYFVYKNVLFLILDTEDYTEEFREKIHHARAEAIAVLEGDHPEEFPDTDYYKMPERKTGRIGEDQNSYFKNVIANHPDVRHTFVFMHKPVWQREGDGNLEVIEKALGDRPYTAINGHLHSYSHTLRNGHDYIMLATTGGGQNANDDNAFDHLTLVSIADDGPAIANIRMDGLLDKTGQIPLGGNQYCYQASKCEVTADE